MGELLLGAIYFSKKLKTVRSTIMAIIMSDKTHKFFNSLSPSFNVEIVITRLVYKFCNIKMGEGPQFKKSDMDYVHEILLSPK